MRLDTLAYTNGLRQIPPAHKIILALVLLLAVQIIHLPAQLAVFLWISGLIVGRANIPKRTYAALLAIGALFLLAGLPAVMVEVSLRDAGSSIKTGHLFAIDIGPWSLSVSQSGAAKALALLVRSVASLSCLYFLLLTVPFVDLLHVLRKARIPPIFTELLLIVYRFVFVLLEAARQLQVARMARGGGSGISRRIRDSGQMVGQLFGRTMSRYRQLYLGLTARGFSGEIRVIPVSRHRHDGKFVIQAIAGCLAVLAVEWWAGGGRW